MSKPKADAATAAAMTMAAEIRQIRVRRGLASFMPRKP
jgi:hypothetical protein